MVFLIIIHNIMPHLKPVSSMNGIVAANLKDRAFIIATREVRKRYKEKKVNQNIPKECKRVGTIKQEENNFKIQFNG